MSPLFLVTFQQLQVYCNIITTRHTCNLTVKCLHSEGLNHTIYRYCLSERKWRGMWYSVMHSTVNQMANRWQTHQKKNITTMAKTYIILLYMCTHTHTHNVHIQAPRTLCKPTILVAYKLELKTCKVPHVCTTMTAHFSHCLGIQVICTHYNYIYCLSECKWRGTWSGDQCSVTHSMGRQTYLMQHLNPYTVTEVYWHEPLESLHSNYHCCRYVRHFA